MCLCVLLVLVGWLTIFRIARKGMWKGGVDGESPAEYKKRHASLEAGGKDEGALTAAKAKTPRSLFSRLFSK